MTFVPFHVRKYGGHKNLVVFQENSEAHMTITGGTERNKAQPKSPEPNFSKLAIPISTESGVVPGNSGGLDGATVVQLEIQAI